MTTISRENAGDFIWKDNGANARISVDTFPAGTVVETDNGRVTATEPIRVALGPDGHLMPMPAKHFERTH